MATKKRSKSAVVKSKASDAAIVSMTGFGRGRARSAAVEVSVECRSVNNRFLDVVSRLPREYSDLDGEVKKTAGDFIQRGRLEVIINRRPLSGGAVSLELNQVVFDAYANLFRGAARRVGLTESDAATVVLREVLSRKDVVWDGDEASKARVERPIVLEALEQALTALKESRSREGARLLRDMSARLRQCQNIAAKISELAAKAPAKIKARLTERIAQLAQGAELDPQRIAGEAAMYADRADITEELVRLRSHCVECERSFALPASGKRLDFLLQELNREFNTIGSKAQDAAIQQLVVDAKVELERMREQVQNVE